MVTVSAPGKIHLMGEHAVVYGKPALLAAINKRLRVTITATPDGAGEPLVIQSTESSDYVRHAVSIVQRELKLSSLPPMTIRIESDIPAGFHLGSSAAVAVATVGASLYFLKKLWNPIEINRIAYEVEKKQHGTPSGGDNTICTMGGFIWYRKELEFLKSIWQLPFPFPPALDHLYLINTGKPVETTGEMVALVKLKVESEQWTMEKLLHTNEQQVKRITVAVKEDNEKELIDAIRVGEQTLEGLGVVSKKVLPLVRAIEQSGGAAKILGGGGQAGGVGFLLCYHRDRNVVEAIGQKFGYPVEQVHLGAEGILLESK